MTTATASQVERRLDTFEAFCRDYLTVEDGTPLELEDFQREMFTDLFGGTRETLILIPKKNGKSTMLAALALFHLVDVVDAECVIAAASRDQAGIMLRQAHGFIQRSDQLKRFLLVKQREIVTRVGAGRCRILASDVDTADGVIPTLALVDELHRHKSADLYGVFRDGLGPRKGQMVTISTAGDDDESPLGVLRKMAHALPGLEVNGAHRHVSHNGFALHEWCLSPDDDLDDLELVKTANPASWQTVEALRERHDSPSMKRWQWARFACGVWLAGEDAAISDKEWRACADPAARIPAGATGVYVGTDLAWKWDTAAFVPVWRDGAGAFVVGPPTIIHPPGDGTAIPEDELWAAAEEMAAIWRQPTFVLDPNAGGEAFAQRIDNDLQARVATHTQAPRPMALAAQRLSETITGGKLKHPDVPELTAQVLAAAPKPVGEGWRFVKQRKKKLPIDAVIGLAMAVSAMIGTDDEPDFRRASW